MTNLSPGSRPDPGQAWVMDMKEQADLLDQVWREERQAQEGIYVVVHPQDEEDTRQALDLGGYEDVHIVAHVSMLPGNCSVMRATDITWHREPWDQLPIVEPRRIRRPFWLRILDALR